MSETLPPLQLQEPALSCSGWHPGLPANQILSLCRRNATSSHRSPCFPELHWSHPENQMNVQQVSKKNNLIQLKETDCVHVKLCTCTARNRTLQKRNDAWLYPAESNASPEWAHDKCCTCAATVWDLVGKSLVMQAVLKPASDRPNAALSPAPPAPTTTASNSWSTTGYCVEIWTRQRREVHFQLDSLRSVACR